MAAETQWIHVDSLKSSGSYLRDLDTQESPILVAGASKTFRFGFFRGGEEIDLTGVVDIRLQLRESQSSSEDTILAKTVTAPLNATELKLTAWNNKTDYNVEATATAAEMDYTFDTGVTTKEVWMVLVATFAGSVERTLGMGPVTLVKDNAPEIPNSYFWNRSEISIAPFHEALNTYGLANGDKISLAASTSSTSPTSILEGGIYLRKAIITYGTFNTPSLGDFVLKTLDENWSETTLYTTPTISGGLSSELHTVLSDDLDIRLDPTELLFILVNTTDLSKIRGLHVTLLHE